MSLLAVHLGKFREARVVDSSTVLWDRALSCYCPHPKDGKVIVSLCQFTPQESTYPGWGEGGGTYLGQVQTGGVPTLARSRWGVPTLAGGREGVPTLARSRQGEYLPWPGPDGGYLPWPGPHSGYLPWLGGGRYLNIGTPSHGRYPRPR